MVALLASILIPKPAAFAATTGHKTPAKPELNVVVIGDLYSYGYATSSAAALRKSVPPTLQALNEVQAANRGVKLNVLFIPVPVAGNQAELPALIRAVRDSSVVIVGVGGGNAALAGPMRSVLFDSAAPARAFPQLMTRFYDGYYLSAQTALLDAVASLAAPGTSIVTIGYPAISTEQGASGFAWWSPFTWGTVSQQQANMSDQLIAALNTANQQATSIVAATHAGLHFLDADLSGALSSSQQGPKGPVLTAIGNDLLPYISQAVDNELVARDVDGAQSALPSTPVPPWKLHVVFPIPTQTTVVSTGRASSRTSQAQTPPPQNNQANPASPVYQPPSFPGLLVTPLVPVAASPPEGTAPTAQGSGNGNEQPTGNAQDSGLPAANVKPAGTTVPAQQPTAPQSPSPQLPIALPVLPALSTALPEPLTPAPNPDATDPGKDPSPAGGKGTSPTAAIPNTGDAPVTGAVPTTTAVPPVAGSAPVTGGAPTSWNAPVVGAVPVTEGAQPTGTAPAANTGSAPATNTGSTGAASVTGTVPTTMAGATTGAAPTSGTAPAIGAGSATGTTPTTTSGTATTTDTGATSGAASVTGNAPPTGAAPSTSAGATTEATPTTTAGTATTSGAGSTTEATPTTGSAPATDTASTGVTGATNTGTTTGAAPTTATGAATTGIAPTTGSASAATTAGTVTGTAPATGSAPATTVGAANGAAPAIGTAPTTTVGSGSGPSGSASGSGATAEPSANGTARASGAVS